jgi:hypothetical protein
MLVTEQEYKYFLKQFGSKYSYSEVFKTRRRFHVKWVITNKPTFGYGNRGGIPRNTGCYTAIPSMALDDDLVQYLIVYKKAQPVPPKMGEILDWMYCWGRGIDHHWYSHVVDWMHFLLYHKLHLSDEMVLKDCLEYRIRTMINMRGLDYHSIIVQWRQFFKEQYSRGITSYHTLAVYSFHWLDTAHFNLIPTSPVHTVPNVIASSP